jgi:hypothetical protein
MIDVLVLLYHFRKPGIGAKKVLLVFLVPPYPLLYFISRIAACEAANRAIGTRNGEQLT